jgi:hypothetical protein
MAINPEKFLSSGVGYVPYSKEKKYSVPFEKEVAHIGRDEFVYAPEESSEGILDLSQVLGPEGMVGPEYAKLSGQEYEHDLVGDVSDMEFITTSSGKTLMLGEAYRFMEHAKKKGAALDRAVFFASARTIQERFDEFSSEQKATYTTQFLNDLHDVLETQIASINEKEAITCEARVYPCTGSPMDSFGVDFFVDVVFPEGDRRRVHCDVTKNLSKDVVRGFTHLIIAQMHIPGAGDMRAYRAQLAIVAQYILGHAFAGQPRRSYDHIAIPKETLH